MWGHGFALSDSRIFSDRAVDLAYGRRDFKSEAERVGFLFACSQRIVGRNLDQTFPERRGMVRICTRPIVPADMFNMHAVRAAHCPARASTIIEGGYMNFRCLLMMLLVVVLTLPAAAHADLDGFLAGLNGQARTDIDGYGVRLSAQFGVPETRVHSLLRSVAVPADAFMCLQLGQMLGLPPEQVLRTYSANRGRGWGVVAKELGIKPGSAEFHALKRGDFVLMDAPGREPGAPSHARGKGKEGGQGHGKEAGQGQGKGKGHNK
ncbi:hypothetical protein Despr_2176 [Desulfobulbus propionicus DSM 2032]|uniref:Uncharacterized protein n=2 Tax=Desulfobulbus propionicus TaxID=894 RepID=A0A7U3YMW5_DESPD|nr:hypothetical protein Despr_2176 [Desulfobulbus propionicus DSM 2032]